MSPDSTVSISEPFDTVWPADSVEFCPHEGSESIFVCGTYQLEEHASDNKQHRRGKCLVFQVTSAENKSILPSSTPLLGIADSEGTVSVHEWQADDHVFHCLQKIQCASRDVLCLSLDWSNRRYPSSHLGSLIVSLSDGALALLIPSISDGLAMSSQWHAHNYEPWAAAWNYWESSTVYSGGDDLTLKGWDVRQPLSSPIFVNKRFDAGITSIQSHPYVEHLVAVGSYDSTVRLFDVRQPLSTLATMDVGGGAWRTKWHPSPERKSDLLVACMHDGFKVVGIGDAKHFPEHSGPTRIENRFDEHGSLAYGVDWSYDQGTPRGETLIASCSFYDNKLYLWSG
ncbi:hypothetical protein ID866_2516 [Astraeus odoratus]|nr:hypothetical protein ID866_2516 [Astraeus odoratus]